MLNWEQMGRRFLHIPAFIVFIKIITYLIDNFGDCFQTYVFDFKQYRFVMILYHT